MDSAKRQRLEAAGWKVGTVEEFLELTPEKILSLNPNLVITPKEDIPVKPCLSLGIEIKLAIAKALFVSGN